MCKIVSFKVAKAIKEAGYPQPQTDVWGYVNRPNNCYFTGRHSYYDENRERRLEWDETNEFHITDDWADEIEPSFYGSAIAAPSYLKVWLWLWREKEIKISHRIGVDIIGIEDNDAIDGSFDDPEGAIISAIEYLVDNNLIE